MNALWSLVCAPSLLVVGMASAADIYVAPTGDDRGAGSRQHPFRTLARAQQRVRELTAATHEDVTVHMANGKYYLDEALVLTAEDSGTESAPIVWAGESARQVILSGGLPLRLNWTPFRDGIMRAPVPEGLKTDQLFVNGVRLHLARYPNYDPQAQYFNGFSEDATSPERVAGWADPTGGFVHAMHRSLWGDFHYRITGKNPDGTLQWEGGWQNNRQMGPHPQYRFVENIFEELDAPGEWFLDDETSTLYVYPPPDVPWSEALIELVRLPHLIEFRGSEDRPVRHVTFRNVTLTHTTRTFMDNREPLVRSDWTTYRGGAIFFDGAEDCAVRDCVLDQVGGNAVFVSRYNRRVEITGCRICDAGANGVSFVGDPRALRSPRFEYHQTQTLEQMDKTPGPQSRRFPAHCLVENNLVTRNGRFEKQTAGVNICMSSQITVRHNSIYDCPRAGINICDGAFGGHLIEWNDVFDTVKETGDHGSFNSWGRDRFWHPDRQVTVRWLEEYPDMPKWDCVQPIVLRNNRWRCDHGWDIDLDDGSSHYEIYNNLCLGGGVKLREGYFRRVFNNIIVNNTLNPHVWYPACATTFQRNIVWEDRYRPARMPRIVWGDGLDFNLVHTTEEPSGPAVGLQKLSGADRHSIRGDARFVDPLRGDYRVGTDSPALALGFESFPMDRFGVQTPTLKRLAQTPPLPGTLSAADIVSRGWGRKASSPQSASWLGAIVKNIESDGERSAVGLGDGRGVLVVRIQPGSVAEAVGLREGDVIRGLDGPVPDLKTLATRVKTTKPQPTMIVTVWRNQSEVQLRFTPSQRD